MTEPFVLMMPTLVCGACSGGTGLDGHSYDGDRIVRVIVFCYNKGCKVYGVRFEVDIEELKLKAKLYGAGSGKLVEANKP